MTTYASKEGVKWTLLGITSMIFCIGVSLGIYGSVMMVGVEGLPSPTGTQPGPNEAIKHYQDRFPSVGSGSVLLIFGILIMFNSGLGITGIHLDDPGIIDTFGYSSFICCFIKFLFVFASLLMHQFNYKYNPLSTIGPRIGIFIAIIEIAIGLAGCQLAKVIKRGDAAEPKLQPWPGKV